MSYIFHVRNWNIDFFEELEKSILINEPKAKIVWLTMQKESFIKLGKNSRNVTYLPDIFMKNLNSPGEEIFYELDQFMCDKFGYGIEYIYELERFKPDSNNKQKFISGHIKALMELMPNNAKMIALSCDHFAYIISAYINEMKGGKNYFIQPLGFPMNAQVIMENPWDLNYFRQNEMDFEPMEKYIGSLSKSPMETIHYMKTQKMISLGHSFIKRINDLIKYRSNENMFTYLDELPLNIIPDRFKQKKQINYRFNYLYLSDIITISKNRKLFYFPLQFEPEMSILAYSPWYKSQLEIIRLISQSLKYGDVLLLKENPKMIGKRDRTFYQTISKHSNVQWADPSLNSREIIRNSFKVISITGTATIEAVCLGVNSMIFGYPPFRALLIEKPISDLPLGKFIESLYRSYPAEINIDNVKKGWSQYSRCLFFGNFIPQYINNKFTIAESTSLAHNFNMEVLSKS